MTTTQIIVYGGLILLILIGYVKTMFSKNEIEEDSWRFFELIFIFIFIFLTLLEINKKQNDLKKLKGKCPEYEKIENVYKLK